MTVEDARPRLREHREELLESIRKGIFMPQLVRGRKSQDRRLMHGSWGFPQS